MTVVKPPRLKKGDLISVISPASPPKDSSKVQAGVRYFESLGYRVTISQNVFDSYGYLAGTDEERADDINQAFADKNVKAIICSRGGYGTPRILDRVDYSVIRQNPKIFVGYSDITSLQLAIFKKTRLVTFSGPMMGVEFGEKIDSYSEESFFKIVTSVRKPGKVKNPQSLKAAFKGKRNSVGRLLGGNLTMISVILGTEYVPSFDEAVLLIEEVNEEPYSVDRMFTQLRLAGILDKLNGFALGQFTNCSPEDPAKPHRTLEQILDEDIFSIGKPSISNLAYGHLPVKMTLPIGTLVSIDPARKKFSLEEPAVV
ncbi:MAG TPA: LD-carboxypeptidase [Candidatus Kryptonia bacterium]